MGEKRGAYRSYDFLGGAAAAVAALAVDAGDDGVGLGALLHAPAQDVLHRLTDVWWAKDPTKSPVQFVF